MRARTIEAALKKFPEQLLLNPSIKNAERLVSRPYTIVLGMGGSKIAANLLSVYMPKAQLVVHGDYGLPLLPDNIYTQARVIACSFSGNTEEVLDGFERAMEMHLHTVVIASGGVLLKKAKETGVPYIIVPDDVPQPRFATGYFVRALLSLIGSNESITKLQEFASSFNSEARKEDGKELAARLENRIPIIYTSTRNAPIGYNWKIRFNETSKIPAFSNIIPESNHNELQGFVAENLSEQFYALFLIDTNDDKRVQKRMHRTAEMYRGSGMQSEHIQIEGRSVFEKIFSTVLFADWTSLALAHIRGVEPGDVALIEEFKKQLQS